jgi:hypothetical protein
MLKPPGTKRLKLKYDELLSKFAYKFDLRRYTWVVIDSSINPEQMEFYASDASRGGVLEPEGVVDIKFRREDLVKAMKRTCPAMQRLADTAGGSKAGGGGGSSEAGAYTRSLLSST